MNKQQNNFYKLHLFLVYDIRTILKSAKYKECISQIVYSNSIDKLDNQLFLKQQKNKDI